MRTRFAAGLLLALALAACGAAAGPSPSPAATLAPADLKFRIVDQLGPLWYCDPDFYPIARVNGEQDGAEQRFPEIQKDAETYAAILRHERLDAATQLTAAQRLAIYRDWKMLNALRLTAQGDRYAFSIIVRPGNGPGAGGERIEGTIDRAGNLAVASRQPSGAPNCPICLAAGTRIATPAGDVPVAELREGDVVWTLDAAGGRVAAPLVAVGSMRAPDGHVVIRVVLDDGRVVSASPGHPTADGRRVGDLRPEDVLDGAHVVAVERVAYAGYTYDVLPAGATGVYWADGVLLGSTLR